MKLNIKLQEAIKAIGISDFMLDDLLTIALTELSDLNHPDFPKAERQYWEGIYRRLAFLGDTLFDSVLADYLFYINPELSNKELDDLRREITSRESLTNFAIELGLPKFSSSCNKTKQKSPQEVPQLWAEMFEAVIGVVFIDVDRDFQKLSRWLCDRFIRPAIRGYVGDQDYDTTVTTADYLDMIGLEGSLSSVLAPGGNDD